MKVSGFLANPADVFLAWIAKQVESTELEAMEAELGVSDILLFRAMAERKTHGDGDQVDEEEVFQDATEVM